VKLKDNRDQRGLITRRQGVLQYRLANENTVQQQQMVDPAKLKQIIFNGKPKRVFKTNQNQEMGLQDPKRVHTALREFNDLSANSVFTKIIQ